MARSFFRKKPNRKAQAVVTTTAVIVTAAATSLISIPVAIVGTAAWWITGKATKK